MEHLDKAIEEKSYVKMDKVLQNHPFLRKYDYMVLYFREACWKDNMLLMKWVWSRCLNRHLEMAEVGYECAIQHKKYEMAEWIKEYTSLYIKC